MKKHILIACLFLGLIVITPHNSWAWGKNGHRVIGEIAQRHLSKSANKKIKALLGNESIAMSSNWADFIKSNPAYNYLNAWHFINLPAGISADSVKYYLKNDTTANVYNKINLLVADLKNPQTTQTQKSISLKLLIHLVGDLHQPFHASHKDDLGGNKILVNWFNDKSNLHRVWDENLVEYQELSYTEMTNHIDHASENQIKEWQSTSLDNVVVETYSIAEKLYLGVQQNDKLMYKYNYDNVDILEQQLLKGGIRLAAILEDIF